MTTINLIKLIGLYLFLIILMTFISCISDSGVGLKHNNDNNIYLSQSYGRKNNSRISVYSNPLEGFADNNFVIEKNLIIPVWILDEDKLIIEIISPPMTEGIADYKGAIAVLYESGSDKYRSTAKTPRIE